MSKPITKSVRLSEQQAKLLKKYFNGSIHEFLDKFLTVEMIAKKLLMTSDEWKAIYKKEK